MSKDSLKRVLPAPVLATLRFMRIDVALRRAYRYDRRRFMRYSSTVSPYLSQRNLASRITESYHNIEKGLSLPEPRPGFGALAIGRLLDYVQRYLESFGEDEVTRAALAALVDYLRFSEEAGLSDAEIPHAERIRAAIGTASDTALCGGARRVTRTQVFDAVSSVGIEFFESRSSVRHFEPGPVSEEDIHFAVRAALKSPAVCNRQFARIHLMTDPGRIVRALEIQGGARGFLHQVPALAIVTTDLRNFWDAGERMQAWTDGGMFAMSFVLGLHARGLGSVCLNWSKTEPTDRALRKEFDIAEEEVIIMMVAFGHLRDTYRVAASPRRSVEAAIVAI